jgi:hypothetical protein
VADAPVEGRLRPAVALALVAGVVGLVGVVAILNDYALFRQVPLRRPPDELAGVARQTLADFGYRDRPADASWHFLSDSDGLQRTAARDHSPTTGWRPAGRRWCTSSIDSPPGCWCRC